MDYEMLFSPMNIGPVTIKNRIALSPMLMGFGQFDGMPTQQMIDYYAERAKGGTGIIFTEITRINDKTGAAAFAQLAASHDYHIEGLKKLADAVHVYGAKLFVQLHHPGRQNIGLLVGTVPMCISVQRIWKGYSRFLYGKVVPLGKKLLEKNLVPASVSASKAEPSYFAGGRVRALRHGEIKKLVSQFVDGAVRAQKAGVDGVELHATHGYLIQQFLSPHTNFRTDEYGGSFENRLRFLSEIVQGIREKCGNYPIVVRLSADECYDKIGKAGVGYGLEEGVRYAKAIEAMGVDAIDVSSAAYDTFNYWLEPTSFRLGWRAYMAAAIKKEVKIPVLAANLIRSPQQAEQQLQDGVQDFVSLGRPHIADPHWAEKVQSGKEEEVKRCICCLYCIQSMQDNAYIGSHGGCSVNPTVGREAEDAKLTRDGEGKKVVIVGGGVAGLTCAETLARRGFAPVVLERNAETGGQVNLSAMPPLKEKMKWCVEDLTNSAKRLGVEIQLNTSATAESVLAMRPYAVIIATGGEAVRPRSIEGVNGDNVYTTTQILTGEVQLSNKQVAVIGSGMTGLETAEMLAEQGNKLTVIEMAGSIAPGTWFQHLDDAIPRLEATGTQFLVDTKLVGIRADGVDVQNVKSGEAKKLACDAVVLSLGVRPVNALAKELEGKVERLQVIGDASKVGRIADATSAGYNAAIALK